MGVGSAIIERYVWRVVVPYFFLAWILLTAILLLQQASRYTDILFAAHIPSSLVGELFLALLPNILAFTSPMALFAGVMIGFGQLRGDSELVAMRAAGVSNLRVIAPALLLGSLLTFFTLFINFQGVPRSAQLVRQVAVKAALAKLESPLEPGVFNNEIPKYVIFAREGNIEKGVWEKVFIHASESNGQVRLITARSGKIDASNEQSELVLQDAKVTTFDGGKQIALDKVASLRVAMEMGRKQLLDRLQKVERAPEEMGISELAAFAGQKSGKEKLDAEVLWHRRVSLAFAPLVFALLGVALSLRFTRGGRGYNGILALFCLVCYYLATLFAEQSARVGTIPSVLGGWLTPTLVLIFSLWILFSERRRVNFGIPKININSIFVWIKGFFQNRDKSIKRTAKRERISVPGLLEKDLFSDLIKYFTFTCAGLLFLYLIFTTFELWRFAATAPGGFVILFRYLFYISPVVIYQVSPSALLLAVLFTYALKSRKSELIAWSAAGQNFVRLLLPAFILSFLVGSGSWYLQENVLPQSNRRQDSLRAQLRGGGAAVSQEGRFWFAEPQKIYSFTADKNQKSDAEFKVKEVAVYSFDEAGVHLQKAIKSGAGMVGAFKIDITNPEVTVWKSNLIEVRKDQQIETEVIEEGIRVSGAGNSRFFYESIDDLEKRIRETDSVSEERRLRVVLQKHYAAAVLPLVIVLFSAPFAMTFGRRGNGKGNLTLVSVLGIWLLYLGVAAIFEQLGNMGYLTGYLAAWSPIFILASFATYLLTKKLN